MSEIPQIVAAGEIGTGEGIARPGLRLLLRNNNHNLDGPDLDPGLGGREGAAGLPFFASLRKRWQLAPGPPVETLSIRGNRAFPA